ncbi:Signal transduction histidine kinase [Polaromonas sp. YR568]|uniref:response regulator n=1 Tax=Polaromonas sp. YR568 TaxID=1855301 RepID=UPI0008F1D049|nr:response regulator [Polaromonas sp. YR568]SFU47400.1 Signal transduction histidine kinase [Polaromonas sp. YR568]
MADMPNMPATDRVNILIVDDLPEKHVVMRSILEELGQNIVSARSGREALRLVLQMEFAAILLDVNMPDIDGLETASLIRQYKKTAQTPILFITAYVDELQAAKGYALGAVDYISSPVVPGVLRSKVKVFVDLHRMNRQLQLQAVEREALARAEAARTAAEDATRRAAYLSEASQRLSMSLNIDATAHALADIAVPSLGAMAAVALLDSHGELHCRCLKIAGDADPSVGPVLLECHRELSAPMAAMVRNAMLARKIEFLPATELCAAPAISAAFTASAQPSWPELPADHEEMALCPLVAGEQMLGALILFGKAGGFAQADAALLSEVVGRASIAMENARLYTLVQEADRRKNEFLAMLAHELRNPLAPIRNAVHIINGTKVADPTVVWARDVIARQVDHMSRMVDDLLDVSRIVRGKVAVHMEPLLLSTLCERAVEASGPLLAARQQELTVDIPAEAVVLRGDLVRLSQVLSNLLNNASKFTDSQGKITLSASLQGEGVGITVTDSGQGIEAEFLPHIFDLFAQGDQALDRAQGGLGIGLTLVKHLVELHKGTVEAFSEGRGKGSRISVYFPASLPVPGAALPATDAPKTAKPVQAASRKVLVVDDLPASADTLKVLLELEGFVVRIANDGATALAIAQEFVPDVLILDIGLPGMDGFEVARQLRSRPESKNAVLIALTGYGEAESRLRSQKAGFDHHVVKPADIDFLLSIVSQPPA